MKTALTQIFQSFVYLLSMVHEYVQASIITGQRSWQRRETPRACIMAEFYISHTGILINRFNHFSSQLHLYFLQKQTIDTIAFFFSCNTSINLYIISSFPTPRSSLSGWYKFLLMRILCSWITTDLIYMLFQYTSHIIPTTL